MLADGRSSIFTTDTDRTVAVIVETNGVRFVMKRHPSRHLSGLVPGTMRSGSAAAAAGRDRFFGDDGVHENVMGLHRDLREKLAFKAQGH